MAFDPNRVPTGTIDRAAEVRADRRRKDRNARVVAVSILAVLLIAVVGVLLVQLLDGGDSKAGGGTPSAGASAPVEGSPSPSVTPGTSTVPPRTATAPAGGIPVGANGAAGATPVGTQVDVFVDYLCPVCKQFEDMNVAALDEALEAGTITLVIHPVSILDRFSQGTAYPTRAAAAVALVAEADPAHFLAFHQALFSKQPAENTPGLTDAQIAATAAEAGVAAEVVAQISEGAAMKQFGGWVVAQTASDAQDPTTIPPEGLTGTPTILIDGQPVGSEVWADPAAFKAAIGGK